MERRRELPVPVPVPITNSHPFPPPSSNTRRNLLIQPQLLRWLHRRRSNLLDSMQNQTYSRMQRRLAGSR